jgi:tyrosyl-tRNA synthetase
MVVQGLADLLLGAEELPSGGLAQALARSGDRPLRIKLGFDPTKPDLHIGHAVILWALRRFQDAGHQLVIIIGDFTARIGDPTGKQEARPPLSAEEVEENARTYLAQMGRVIDLEKAEIHRNSEWLGGMDLTAAIRLMGQATVAQMLARENFALRYERGDAIGLHEFLYPLLQGYDSVAIQADVELGGTDQKFNNLMGRHLQENADMPPQTVLLYSLLEGIGTSEKMSKSLNNYIALTDAPKIMYDKVMAIADHQMPDYYTLASGLSAAEIMETVTALKAGTLDPRAAKLKLAWAITRLYHGQAIADALRGGAIGDTDIPCVILESSLPTPRLMVALKLSPSTSQARERLKEGAVRLMRRDGASYAVDRVLSDPSETLELTDAGLVLQVGKKYAMARLVEA